MVCQYALGNTESSNLCALRKPSLLGNSENVHIQVGKDSVNMLARMCKHKLRGSDAQN